MPKRTGKEDWANNVNYNQAANQRKAQKKSHEVAEMQQIIFGNAIWTNWDYRSQALYAQKSLSQPH